TKNVHYLLYKTNIMGLLRGDGLHMDNNCTVKALNHSGFGSSPDQFPRALRHHGMLLKQSGPPESLLRHMLQSGLSDGLTDGLLQLIVRRIGAKHVKMGEKRMGKKSWLWSIILHVFPDLPTEEQTDMLLEMLGGKVRESFVPDEIADGALKAMPREDVVNDFAALREKLDKSIAEKRFKEEVTRKVGERGEREH
ncbi:Uncharacterized protein SCF082_LOCUS46583, partial [Durusdinium trenchii]